MLIKVAVIIQQKGKFLLVQEKAEQVHGLWSWIQGSVDGNESLELAAVREAKEETGLDIYLVEKVKIIENPFPNTKEIHVYRAEAREQKLVFPKEEIINIGYFTFEEIKNLPLVARWIYDTLAGI